MKFFKELFSFFLHYPTAVVLIVSFIRKRKKRYKTIIKYKFKSRPLNFLPPRRDSKWRNDCRPFESSSVLFRRDWKRRESSNARECEMHTRREYKRCFHAPNPTRSKVLHLGVKKGNCIIRYPLLAPFTGFLRSEQKAGESWRARAQSVERGSDGQLFV